jgi:hypothetical protein
LAVVETHVRSTRLSPDRKRELVAIGSQVPEAVYRGSGPMGDDTLYRSSVPGEDSWCELKPGGTELEVLHRRSTSELVDPLSHPLEHRGGSQALNSGRRDTRLLGLAASHESPLIPGDLRESADR